MLPTSAALSLPSRVQTIPGKRAQQPRAMHKSLAYTPVFARSDEVRTQGKGNGVSEICRVIRLPSYAIDRIENGPDYFVRDSLWCAVIPGLLFIPDNVHRNVYLRIGQNLAEYYTFPSNVRRFQIDNFCVLCHRFLLLYLGIPAARELYTPMREKCQVKSKDCTNYFTMRTIRKKLPCKFFLDTSQCKLYTLHVVGLLLWTPGFSILKTRKGFRGQESRSFSCSRRCSKNPGSFSKNHFCYENFCRILENAHRPNQLKSK